MRTTRKKTAIALIITAIAIISTAIATISTMPSQANSVTPADIPDGATVQVEQLGGYEGWQGAHVKRGVYNGVDYGYAFCVMQGIASADGTEQMTISNLVGSANWNPANPDGQRIVDAWTDRQVQDVAIAQRFFFEDNQYQNSNSSNMKLREFQRWLWGFQATGCNIDAAEPAYYTNTFKDDVGGVPYDSSLYRRVCDYVKANRGKYKGHGRKLNTYKYNGRQDRAFFWSEVQSGYLNVKKTSNNTNITNNNGSYNNLGGAEYTVYGSNNDATNNTNSITKVETDSNGNTNTVEIPVTSLADGKTAYIKETKAPKGYRVDKTIHKLTLMPGETATLTTTDTPINYTDDFELDKITAEANSGKPQGEAKLVGAEYSITYKDNSGKTQRTWVFKTDNNGLIALDVAHKVSGDNLYTDENGTVTYPIGTYEAKETKAPEGYLLNDKTITATITQDNDTAKLKAFEKSLEQVKREDLTFQKKDEDTQERMANVVFLVTSKATGEQHVIMTDENGTYSSTYPAHTTKTNANDDAITKDENGNITVDETKLDPEAGTFFTGYANGTAEYKTVKVDDTKRAFPYDTYEIQELRTKANEGHNLIDVTVTLHRDGFDLNYGTLNDKTLGIGTTAKDSESGNNYATTSKKTTIIDTVSYHGLTPEKEYEMTGTLHLVAEDGTDAGEIDGSTNTVKFTPEEADGSVDIPMTFDSTKLAGRTVVAFEELRENKVVAATHMDIEDEGQSVHFPTIHTTATDGEDGNKDVDTNKTVTINDVVNYSGLVPGREYVMTGVLHVRGADGSDAGVLKDKDGNPVTATATFTPESVSGSVTISFKFDVGSLDADTSVVAFEECSENGVTVATHADIKDEAQTVILRNVSESPKSISKLGTSLGVITGVIIIASGIVIIVMLRNRSRCFIG